MKWWVLGGLVALLAVAMGVQAWRGSSAPPVTIHPLHPVYAAGQRWRVRARPLEEGATVTVLEVHADAQHTLLIHVRVNGVRLETPAGIVDNITHLPLSVQAFEASITRLFRAGQPLGDYHDTLRRWKAGYDAGRWPCITTSVEDGIRKTEQSMQLSGR